MMLVMFHTPVRQQLLTLNVPLDVLKKINVNDQTRNVDQMNIGLNVTTVLKLTVIGGWLARNLAPVIGQNAA